jgi:hypothetical protein
VATLQTSVFVFRLAALYVWIQTIQQVTFLPTIVSLTSDDHLGRANWIGYAIMVGLQALLGTALWFAGPFLANRILGNPSTKTVSRAATIAGLAFSLAGIFVIDLALLQVGQVIIFRDISSLTGSPARFWAACASFATLSILGLALLFGGRKLAARMFRSGVPEQPLTLELQSVAFSVVGIVIVVNALSTILRTQSAPWPAIVANSLRLAIGIALFLGGGVLSRAWLWIRTAGLGADRASSDVPRP